LDRTILAQEERARRRDAEFAACGVASPRMSPTATHGVLFDVGYGLLDEAPRLTAALRWLATHLAPHGITTSAAQLEARYAEACRAPRLPSLLMQVALAVGVDESLARRLRRELPWEEVPMPPYAGAIDALRALEAAGVKRGVLANQPLGARRDLEACGAATLLDDIWLSEAVGLSKPDPAFFRLALTTWGLAAARVAYVGDRPDNDVAPAKALGLHTVRLRLGPHAGQPIRGPAEQADFDARSFAEVAAHLLAWAAE